MRERLALLALVVAAIATPLGAQEVDSLRGTAFFVGGGVSQFDLSGTGTAGVFVARFDRAVQPWLLFDAGASIARVEQAGEHNWLVIPELQLQGQMARGNLRPYIGAGGGIAFDARSDALGGLDTEMTLSAAAGIRAWFKPRVGARAELRVRGIGGGFEGATAEWTGGLTWRM